ncbi:MULTISPECIES: hypothetical protein [Sphingobacterium]|uniref:hypothetical protein n=1 Tax=Sphingobacterium TaxID=28453 RepID=UPI0010E4B8CA|nr:MULTISPECIES: hypothetical protein [Sphingobacterium]MCW2259483.1 hypothetical protein [Sphingobacterium kitahiroshimense]TCR14070.1 hypothetical protein EDF67_101173 [Sphingobacterium sp. JUb78]
MNLKKIHREYILNHPTAVRTGKSRSQLSFRQIAGIRESGLNIYQSFTISDYLHDKI